MNYLLCVTSLQSYDTNSKAIQDKVYPVFDTDHLRKKFDHDKYYKSLLHVYNKVN